MLPPTLFETLEHSFLLKPLLIAGKAMEHYDLRDGQGYTFVIPREEFRSLRKSAQKEVIPNAFGDAGIQIRNYTFSTSQFGFSYASAFFTRVKGTWRMPITLDHA